MFRFPSGAGTTTLFSLIAPAFSYAHRPRAGLSVRRQPGKAAVRVFSATGALLE
jgi:hypothetical protein